MDTRYPSPVSLDKPMPRFIAPGGVTESATYGTWVPIEYVELLAERVRELEGWHEMNQAAAAAGANDRIREVSALQDRIAALEEENRRLRDACRTQAAVIDNSMERDRVGVNVNAVAGAGLRLQWASEGDFGWLERDAEVPEIRKIRGHHAASPSRTTP